MMPKEPPCSFLRLMHEGARGIATGTFYLFGALGKNGLNVTVPQMSSQSVEIRRFTMLGDVA